MLAIKAPLWLTICHGRGGLVCPTLFGSLIVNYHCHFPFFFAVVIWPNLKAIKVKTYNKLSCTHLWMTTDWPWTVSNMKSWWTYFPGFLLFTYIQESVGFNNLLFTVSNLSQFFPFFYELKGKISDFKIIAVCINICFIIYWCFHFQKFVISCLHVLIYHKYCEAYLTYF